MDITELRQGDTVLVEAQVIKIDDGGEGGDPLVLLSVGSRLGDYDRQAQAVVLPDKIHGIHERPAPPADESYPLGTLARSAESQRAAMDKPA